MFSEKGQGTADAFQYIRRMVEEGEANFNQTLLVRLDWERAVDKVRHDEPIEAARRMNIPEQIVSIREQMHKRPTLYVEMDGERSGQHIQETGIRQGCPRSPICS